MATRTLTDTPTIAWDEATAGQVKANVPDEAITNAKLADMAQATIKGRAALAGDGEPTDLSAAQVAAILGFGVGSGSGFIDLTEIAAPASPSANVARLYAFDDGGVTKIGIKDAAGAVVAIGNGLFLPTGAPINWNAGDVTLTHSANLLTLAGGDLALPNLAQTGYHDITEIAAPSSPASNVARAYAVDDGAGVTTMAMKDSAGNVSPLSHFLQAGTGATTRTQQAKQRDLLTVKDFGAVGDGTTNDTTAITAADAITDRKYTPSGIYDVTLTASDLDGPYWGSGQIRDAAENLRAPWFSAIKAAPSSFGNQDSVTTAFNGDLSKVQIAMEHRVTGAASAGQPATGYLVRPEVSPIFIYEFNTAGHNEATGSNDGRTGMAMLNLQFNHSGQGDLGAIFFSGVIGSTRAGATSFLASPAVQGIYGQLFAGATGAYLNPIEINCNDNGNQSAAVGYVPNFNRTVATATLGEVWMGVRPQTSGSTPCDVIYSAAGSWKRGLDFTAVTFDSDKSAINLKADDRVYGNSSSSGTVPWAQTLGSVYFDYSSTKSAWEFAGRLVAPVNLQTVAAVNFNSANSDTALSIALPPGYTRYRISNIIISGASQTLTTATFGVFTASGGGGTAIIAAGTAITVSTAADDTNNNMQTVASANGNTQSFADTSLFFRVGTAQGAPATATVTINYSPVS